MCKLEYNINDGVTSPLRWHYINTLWQVGSFLVLCSFDLCLKVTEGHYLLHWIMFVFCGHSSKHVNFPFQNAQDWMGKNYIEGDLTLFTETPEFAHCGLEDMKYIYKGFHDFINNLI